MCMSSAVLTLNNSYKDASGAMAVKKVRLLIKLNFIASFLISLHVEITEIAALSKGCH